MRHVLAQVTRGIRVERSRATVGLALVAVLAAGACDREVTAPLAKEPTLRGPSFAISAGLTAYTDRATWEAAVATAGGTVVNMNFAGLTLGRVTSLDTDYSTFHLTVDRVAASSFSNPGIDIFADASCSIGVGDCNVFTFNVVDPTASSDAPRVNSLVFPSPVVAFGGNFLQLGMTAPAPGSVTGPVIMHIGDESVTVNDYMDANGNGFFGVISTTANATISFTYTKAASLINDIWNVYNPAYAFAPPSPPPGGGTAEEQLADLREFILGMAVLKGSAASWNDKLDAFAAALAQGRTAKACTELDKFLTKVNDKSLRQLTASDAAALIEKVNAIKTTLGCSGGGAPV